MNRESLLLTDRYRLTMLQGDFDREMNETAVLEFLVRARPAGSTLLIDTYDTEEAARRLVSILPNPALQGASAGSEAIAAIRANAAFKRRLPASLSGRH